VRKVGEPSGCRFHERPSQPTVLEGDSVCSQRRSHHTYWRRRRPAGRAAWTLRVIGITLAIAVTGACSGGGSQHDGPSSDPFSDLQDAPFVAGSGFSIDGTRLVDLMRIQASLQKYLSANGKYPSSLDELLPAFAPLGERGAPLDAIPVDPESHQPYSYQVLDGAREYELHATLSNGRVFPGFSHSPAPQQS